MTGAEDPAVQEWFALVRAHLVPKLRHSAVTVCLVPDQVDVKFAVELGLSIMLDKPIILLVQPGRPVPPKLALLADEIVEGPLSDPTSAQRMSEAISRVRDPALGAGDGR